MALAALRGEKTLAGLAEQFDVHPNQISQWRTRFLEGASGVFGAAVPVGLAPAVDVKTLHAKIGELALENDLLSGALRPRRVCSSPEAVQTHRATSSLIFGSFSSLVDRVLKIMGVTASDQLS